MKFNYLIVLVLLLPITLFALQEEPVEPTFPDFPEVLEVVIGALAGLIMEGVKKVVSGRVARLGMSVVLSAVFGFLGVLLSGVDISFAGVEGLAFIGAIWAYSHVAYGLLNVKKKLGK